MPERCGADGAKRICLVSPGHVSFNPRLVKEANALQAAGFQVHVIAAGNVPYLRGYDAEIFARAEWSWETVSYSNRAHHQFLRVRRKFSRYLVKLGSRNLKTLELAHHLLAAPLAKAVMRNRADLYIAHYIAAIPPVAAAAARRGALTGFDAEDFHSGEFNDASRASLDALIVTALETAYLPSFDHITAASPGIAAAYAHRFPGLTPTPILNVFPLDQAPPRPQAPRQNQRSIAAHWFSQTIGENRGLETVLSALACANCPIDLYIRGSWQHGYRDKFNDLAKNLGVLDQVHELPLVAPAEIERAAAIYDIGLVCETGHSKNREIALTNKIFSYMLAGLAIVATDIESHRHLKASGANVHLYKAHSVDSLARIFEQLNKNTTDLFASRLDAWMMAQTRYNWDYERNSLIKVISKILESDSM